MDRRSRSKIFTSPASVASQRIPFRSTIAPETVAAGSPSFRPIHSGALPSRTSRSPFASVGIAQPSASRTRPFGSAAGGIPTTTRIRAAFPRRGARGRARGERTRSGPVPGDRHREARGPAESGRARRRPGGEPRDPLRRSRPSRTRPPPARARGRSGRSPPEASPLRRAPRAGGRRALRPPIQSSSATRPGASAAGPDSPGSPAGAERLAARRAIPATGAIRASPSCVAAQTDPSAGRRQGAHGVVRQTVARREALELPAVVARDAVGRPHPDHPVAVLGDAEDLRVLQAVRDAVDPERGTGRLRQPRAQEGGGERDGAPTGAPHPRGTGRSLHTGLPANATRVPGRDGSRLAVLALAVARGPPGPPPEGGFRAAHTRRLPHRSQRRNRPHAHRAALRGREPSRHHPRPQAPRRLDRAPRDEAVHGIDPRPPAPRADPLRVRGRPDLPPRGAPLHAERVHPGHGAPGERRGDDGDARVRPEAGRVARAAGRLHVSLLDRGLRHARPRREGEGREGEGGRLHEPDDDVRLQQALLRAARPLLRPPLQAAGPRDALGKGRLPRHPLPRPHLGLHGPVGRHVGLRPRDDPRRRLRQALRLLREARRPDPLHGDARRRRRAPPARRRAAREADEDRLQHRRVRTVGSGGPGDRREGLSRTPRSRRRSTRSARESSTAGPPTSTTPRPGRTGASLPASTSTAPSRST